MSAGLDRPTLPVDAGWIVRPRPVPDARARLVCCPYAGGAASIYRAWAPLLPPGIELCALQLPGREQRHREPPLTSMEAVVQATVQAILPLADRPLVLFGHSMGAIIAYEVARALALRGVFVRHLIVSGRRAPHLPALRDSMHDLPDADLVRQLLRLNGTPAEVLENDELLAIILPVVRADFRVIETYVRRDPHRLTCDMSVLGGVDDPDVDLSALNAWREVTTGHVEVRMFPGDHFYLNGQLAALVGFINERMPPGAAA